MGGGAAYSYLHTGVKLWCAATRNSFSRLLERCYNDVASSREATFFTFHLQRPGDLIYIPPLRTHVVLTMSNIGYGRFFRGGTLIILAIILLLKGR